MTKPKGRTKYWAESVGPYGARIRVFERRKAGVLFATIPAADPGRVEQLRLPGMNRGQAVAWAHVQVQALLEGRPVDRPGRKAGAGHTPTWANLLASYLAARTPHKSDRVQDADHQRTELWSAVLGASSHPMRVTVDTWQRMHRERAAGVLNARGVIVVKLGDRRTVRPRVIQAECQWLKQVCGWAVDNWKDSRGEPILVRSPIAGFDIPADGEPRRPVVTAERWKLVRAAAERVVMEDRTGPEHHEQASYLPEILDLMHLTGHRISAILQLRWQDVLFDMEGTPNGVIRWPGDTDKTDWEHSVPMNSAIRQVVDRIRRHRPGIGPTCLFPKPTNRLAPISKERVRTWLLRAEKLAGVPKHDGSLFHAYRRGWATARKHLSLKDVAAAGGWKQVETLMRHYIQTDTATMLQVLDEPLERQA